jgi:MFS family permease
LLVARGIRGFGDGFAAIVLPAYLVAIGFGTVEIGIVAAASLLGSALLTLGVGVVAPRYELRHLLIAGAVLMAATGVALSGEELWWIVVVCFIGTINASSGDIGLMVPLEHTMLARSATDRERTKVFARYSLIGAMSSAVGALAAAGPDLMVGAGIGRIAAFKLMFCCKAAPRSVMSARRSARRAAWSTSLRRCSASTPLPAASSCSRSWRCGCSSISACRCPAPACSFFGPAC